MALWAGEPRPGAEPFCVYEWDKAGEPELSGFPGAGCPTGVCRFRRDGFKRRICGATRSTGKSLRHAGARGPCEPGTRTKKLVSRVTEPPTVAVVDAKPVRSDQA